MVKRGLVLALCFLLASAFVVKVSKTEAAPVRESLASLPMNLGEWQGVDSGRFDSRIEGVLGVDDYVNRTYNSKNAEVGLYIGFYASQREGDTMHSPLNCLPGAGWVASDREYTTIPVVSDPSSNVKQQIEVNRILIEKGLDKQLVLYWYQAHGRVVASEYWGKIYTVLDAIRINRTDAALVRIISPVKNIESVDSAQAAAVEFVQSMFPVLNRYLPD